MRRAQSSEGVSLRIAPWESAFKKSVWQSGCMGEMPVFAAICGASGGGFGDLRRGKGCLPSRIVASKTSGSRRREACKGHTAHAIQRSIGDVIFLLHRGAFPDITGAQPAIWRLPNITGRPTLACFDKPVSAVVSHRQPDRLAAMVRLFKP